jgi:hypothetical protein
VRYVIFNYNNNHSIRLEIPFLKIPKLGHCFGDGGQNKKFESITQTEEAA